MNEHEDGSRISAYLDGALAGAELARAEAHLKDCRDCRLELEGLRAVKKRLAAAPRRAVPPGLVSDLERRLAPAARSWAAPAWLARPPRLLRGGVFAAAALTMALWLGVNNEDATLSVPLEPLLAAHERYSAESLVPQDSLVASNYTGLEAPSGESADQEAE